MMSGAGCPLTGELLVRGHWEIEASRSKDAAMPLYINTLPIHFVVYIDVLFFFGPSNLPFKRICLICVPRFQRFSFSLVPASARRSAPLASRRMGHSGAARNLMAIVARQIPALSVMDQAMSSAAISPASTRPNTSSVAVMGVSLSPLTKPRSTN